jgi:hypothetical protein
MQAIDVTRHSRLTQQLVPPTTVLFRLLFPGCMQKKVAHDFRYDPHTYADGITKGAQSSKRGRNLHAQWLKRTPKDRHFVLSW